VIETLAAVALFLAATLLATDPRRRRVALAAFALGLAWAAAPWAGWANAPAALRSAAILLVPTIPALALLTVSALHAGRRASKLALALAGITIAVDIALWLVRDPFLDRYCWRDCLARSGAPFADADRARALTNLSLTLGVACGLALVALALVPFLGRRARPADALALWAAVPLGAAIALSSLVLRLIPEEDPERPLHAALFVARGLALILFSLGLSAVAVRPRHVRRTVTRLAEEPGGAAGGDLGVALAVALDAPRLRVGYPLDDGRVVDARGEAVALGEEHVRVLRGAQVVAVVGLPDGAEISAASVERALGPSARLALGNERLRAEELARLHELTELRRRIVATGDAERRRLERDLHDGAQQRLLALSFDVRVALSRAEGAGEAHVAAELREALSAVGQATEELRTIAHGIFPAVLTTSGLVAALETLADTAPLLLRCAIDEGARYAGEVETAVYAVVAEAVSGATAPVRIWLDEEDGDLVVTVDDAPWSGGVVAVEDRVLAVGGVIERDRPGLRAAIPVQVS
jgi:signal transduction histidine kinase